MTLTIQKEEDTQRQLLLTIEVAEERVEKAMRQMAKKVAKDVYVPGFRQGKAPYRVIVNRVGREALRAETVDEIMPAIFEEALADIDEADIYGRPELTDVEMEPLVLKFTIPLQPVVKLGDYRSFREEVESVRVTDEAVDKALEEIQIKHQILEDVDRPVEAGDLVALSGLGKLVVEELETAVSEDDESAEAESSETEGVEEAADTAAEQIIFAEESIELLMDSSKVYPNTPFVDNLLGLSAGAQTTFSFTFPDDYEDEELAGKEASFEINVLNVQSRQLPELNDELAQQEGEYESLAEMRSATFERLEKAAEAQAKEDLIGGMTDKLVDDAELVYPPAAVEMELDDMLQTLKSQARYSGWEWDDYLRIQGLSEDALRENFREAAVTRVERGLLIRQFILEEKLRVKAEDVDDLIEERVKKFENEDLQKSMRDYYRQGSGFDSISGEVLHEKVYERIKAIYAGTAPDLSELEDEETGSDEEE